MPPKGHKKGKSATPSAAITSHHVIAEGGGGERGRTAEPFTAFEGRAHSLKAVKRGRPAGSKNKPKAETAEYDKYLNRISLNSLKEIIIEEPDYSTEEKNLTNKLDITKEDLITVIKRLFPTMEKFEESYETEVPSVQGAAAEKTPEKQRALSPQPPESMPPLVRKGKENLREIVKVRKEQSYRLGLEEAGREIKKHRIQKNEREAIRLAKEEEEEATKPSAAPASAAVAAPPVAPVDVPKMKKVEAMISKNLNVENPTANTPASVKKIKNHIGHRVKVSTLTKPKLGESLYKEKLKKYFYNKKDYEQYLKPPQNRKEIFNSLSKL